MNIPGVLHLGRLEHLLIYLCYKIKLERPESYVKIVKDQRKAEIEQVREALSHVRWSVCSVLDGVSHTS